MTHTPDPEPQLRLGAPDRDLWTRGVAPSSLGDPPRSELSRGRVVAALAALTVLLVVAGVLVLLPSTTGTTSARAAAPTATQYVPYVDVTLTPTYAFEDPTANPVSNVALGFVVAARDAATPCTPSWGGAYSLEQARSVLDLDRRVAQSTRQGGTVTVSFGGAANTELAGRCQSVAALTRAYRTVVDRYRVTAVDFDVEGSALGDTAANARRAQAVAALQRELRAQHRTLAVWLTLPAGTTGFTAQGQAAIAGMLRAGVTLAGANAMAMDFAPTKAIRHDVYPAVRAATDAAHRQLGSLMRRAGLPLTAQQLWNRLGVTVMIGRNDVPGQVFTLPAARRLTAYANERRLGRLSIWSLNRDAQCGSVFARVAVLSNTCSGVRQATLGFTRVFSGLRGTSTAVAGELRRAAIPQVAEPPVDDPVTSPYPVWKPGAAYGTAYKVVWHRDVYQAKWYSQNQAPDQPVATASETPWLLLGPVQASDPPMHVEMPSLRGIPAWSARRAYRAGDRVRYRGLPYRAGWYVQDTVPDTTLPPDPRSPWQPLFTVRGEPRNAAEGQ